MILTLGLPSCTLASATNVRPDVVSFLSKFSSVNAITSSAVLTA